MSFHIVVTPRRLGDLGSVVVPDRWVHSTEEEAEAAYKRRCEEIAQQIKRHVNNVESVTVVKES